MKLSELFEAASKQKQETAAEAWARYAKFKRMLELGNPGVTQQQVDGIKRVANSISDTEMKAHEKHMIDTHGADWWELVKKQYPIKEVDGMYVVNSEIVDRKKEKQWEFYHKSQAHEKIEQLAKWVSDGRKRGFGDKEHDIEKWTAKLDALDKAKITTEAKSWEQTNNDRLEKLFKKYKIHARQQRSMPQWVVYIDDQEFQDGVSHESVQRVKKLALRSVASAEELSKVK
jgi:hypothetical protein